jgi:hypothetical protein
MSLGTGDAGVSISRRQGIVQRNKVYFTEK